MSLQVVVGGQFGSEAKGAVTAAICEEQSTYRRVTVVRAGGPNAGHSAIDHQGRLWALRQIPVGMVVDDQITGVIADGSEIDFPVLLDEILRLEDAGIPIRNRLYVSDEATLILDRHKTAEGEMVGRLGSTGKGIGAARADRLMRRAPRVVESKDQFNEYGIRVKDGRELTRVLNRTVRNEGSTVVLEGTQGYGLGLTAGHYPQCTSSNTRAVDFLSMAGINPWGLPRSAVQVHVVVRPYPIRVAGNSGPLYGETSWEKLNLPVELTTVTKKPRRVGTWDETLVHAALEANGPGAILACSMMDQVPEYTEQLGDVKVLTKAGRDWLYGLEAEFETSVGWYGTGPRLQDWRTL